MGYDGVFVRQVEALARPGDVLVGLSTIGRSPNLLRAFEAARVRGVRTIAVLGRDGGALLPLTDIALVVPSWDTQRIQETHLVLLHLLCELVEERLFRERTDVGRSDMTGLPEEYAPKRSMQDLVADAVDDAISSLPKARRRDPAALEQAIARSVRGAVNVAWGKKPLCHVLILQV